MIDSTTRKILETISERLLDISQDLKQLNRSITKRYENEKHKRT